MPGTIRTCDLCLRRAALYPQSFHVGEPLVPPRTPSSNTPRLHAPGTIRTCDLCLRRAALYPLSYGRGEPSLAAARERAVLARKHDGMSARTLPSDTVRTRFTELVGCTVPIQLAPMGSAGTPALATAVTGAGAHAMLAGTLLPPPALAELCGGLRASTSAFGINFLAPVLDPEALDAAAEHAPLVEVFFGAPERALVERIHAGGALASWQVCTASEARAAVDAGCDLVVVQGIEAGGRVWGSTGLLPLLGEVLDAVDVPVVAAGGIATARGVAAVLAAGASAARLGTRFVAASESGAHDVWKDGIVAATAEDAVLSESHSALPLGLGTWPEPRSHRILRSAVEAADALTTDEVGALPTPAGPLPLPRYAVVPPSTATTGEVGAMALYAGQSVGAIHDIRPAAEIVADLARGTADLLSRLDRG